MKIINRDHYTNQIKEIVDCHTPDIKVITGIRRSGKSKLLEFLKEYIINSDESANIIHINFSLLEYYDLMDFMSLYKYVECKYEENRNNYLLIDEVQMCEGFEKAINSFHASEKYDIYIAGSNAFLSSSDLATLFTGRTFEIQVFPFSLKEYIQYHNYNDIDEAFDKYFSEGGMSGAFLYSGRKNQFKYINEIYQTLIIRDIIKKYKIRNTGLLDKISHYLMDTVGNNISSKNISHYLSSHQENGNPVTVSNYISYLCNSYLFYKIDRYDIREKKVLSTDEKYYLADPSFRHATIGIRNLDYGHIYENIVAIELLRRGYDVYVGKLYRKVIDFVAMKRDEKIYIQVSADISSPDTFVREVDPLLSIKDNYPKYLITRTKYNPTDYEGIQIIDIARWLTL